MSNTNKFPSDDPKDFFIDEIWLDDWDTDVQNWHPKYDMYDISYTEYAHYVHSQELISLDISDEDKERYKQMEEEFHERWIYY